MFAKLRWHGLVLALVCLPLFSAEARSVANRTLTDAADSLARRVVKSVSPKGGSFGRTALLVTLNGPLEPELKPYLHKVFEERFAKAKKAEIVQCFRCEALQAHSDGNKIVVEKGIASDKAATAIAQSLSLDTFLIVDVSYVGAKLVMQVKALEPVKNEIVFNKSYKMHTRFLSDKNFMFGLDIGSAYLPDALTDEDKVGASIAAFIGERFYGFGKIGLGMSSVFSVTDFSFTNSTGPYVSANINELTGFHLPWGSFSLFANPGYAVSQKTISFVLRGGAVLELENFVHFTAEYQHPVYSQNPDKEYPRSIIFSVGFDLY